MAIGLSETVISVLVHGLDLVYKPIGFLKNVLGQIRGKVYVWKTGAMSEIETQNATLLTAYKLLSLSTVIGLILFAFAITGILPAYISLFLSPLTASFILGPTAIKLTTKPVPEFLRS
jgi:hypothetical protein